MNLIDSLVADLRPVRPRRTAAIVIGAIIAAQGIAVVLLGWVRPDLVAGDPPPVLVWRTLGSAAFALVCLALALRLRDPARLPGRWPIAAGGVLLAFAAAGWALDLLFPSALPITARLRPASGLDCIALIAGHALPTLVVTALLLRRGAIVRPQAAAAAAGLSAAGTGGFFWALACPIDDPVYTIFWYLLAFGLIAATARLALPALIKLDPARVAARARR